MRAGPKGQITAPPLDLRRLPKRGGARAIAFCERYITVPKGTGAKHRLKLRPWQKAIVHGVLDDPRPRQALVAIPAGNGKSTLAAAIGLYGLLGDGVEGAQVLVVASDERQARIIFRTAKRMVELDKDLSARVQVFADHLLEPRTDSVFMALPADPGSLQGWDPSMALVDELHVVTDDTFEAMAARAGKRDRSLLLAISTPPKAGDDGVMRRLVDHGREGFDPSFYFTEFGAPAGCAVDDEDAWAVANPALDDFLHRDALRATLPPKMRENAFRRYRLGQWVGVDDAWLPDGAWADCADATVTIPDGAEVVLAFDGSFNGDTTVLVAAAVDERPPCRPGGAVGGRRCPSPHRRRRGRHKAGVPSLAGAGDRRRPVQVGQEPPAAGRRGPAGTGVPAVTRQDDARDGPVLRSRDQRRPHTLRRLPPRPARRERRPPRGRPRRPAGQGTPGLAAAH